MPAPQTEFLNVDLEITSRFDVRPLLAELGKRVVVIHSRDARGARHVSLELYDFARYTTPDACITEFARLVERLTPSSRRLWNRAAHRRLDVGIQAGASKRAFTASIRPSTLRRAADIDAELVVTVYGIPTRSRGGSA